MQCQIKTVAYYNVICLSYFSFKKIGLMQFYFPRFASNNVIVKYGRFL